MFAFKHFFLFSFFLMFSSVALAQEVVESSWREPFLAAALGLAALGGTLAQGRAVSSALEGIARNPEAQGKIFTPMILGLAFIESLVIFALIYRFF